MFPYPNPHHFGAARQPQEPPHPNPTGFPMLPPGAHLMDHQNYVDHHHFFPGHGHFNNSETLEAVLRPPRAAPESAAAQGGRGRNGAPAAAAGGHGQGQGHTRARKRPFRTDRHSKIRTAQGVRDRRMRLSLDVARDFFALHDRLGFDKPSKTMDWLLTQAKPAMERLAAAEPSQRGSVGDDAAAALSPPTSGAADGSGKRGAAAEKLASRSGGSASMEMEHTACELDRLVSAAPVLREYYCYGGLSEMMSNDHGGDGDDDGEYEEDGDFLDGMQY